MTVRGLQSGKATVTNVLTQVARFEVGGAAGIVAEFVNDSDGISGQPITAVAVDISYDDAVTWNTYPFATSRDLNVMINKLTDNSGSCVIVLPTLQEALVRFRMQVAANSSQVDFTIVPVEDGGRLGRGVTIDGIDYGIESDVGVATTTLLSVTNAGTDNMIINPECDHFMIQNQSLVPVHLNFGTSLAGGAVPSIVLGPCLETAVGSGVPLLGTGAAIIEEKFKGTVYAYDPLNTPAVIAYTEVGSAA